MTHLDLALISSNGKLDAMGNQAEICPKLTQSLIELLRV